MAVPCHPRSGDRNEYLNCYGTMAWKYGKPRLQVRARFAWRCIILDEASQIKEYETVNATARFHTARTIPCIGYCATIIYHRTAELDTPASGEGSRRQSKFQSTYISGLLPAWVVIDEFHLLKSLAKSYGPRRSKFIHFFHSSDTW